MMQIYKDGVVRWCTDEAWITLGRKGWIEVVDQKPAYNNLTHDCNPVGWQIVDGKALRQYEVVEITESEKKQRAFRSAIAAGFDTGLGYRLALNDGDRAAFTAYTALINQGIELGQMTGETVVKIKDMSGVMHDIDVSSYKIMIFNYGMHYANLWMQA